MIRIFKYKKFNYNKWKGILSKNNVYNLIITLN